MSYRKQPVPPLHDGQLVAVATSSGEAVIHVIAADSEPWTIRLTGVRRLRVSDLMEGNTIFDCTVSGASEGIARELGELLGSGPSNAEYESLKWAIGEGRLKHLGIAPSYGAPPHLVEQSSARRWPRSARP